MDSDDKGFWDIIKPVVDVIIGKPSGRKPGGGFPDFIKILLGRVFGKK